MLINEYKKASTKIASVARPGTNKDLRPRVKAESPPPRQTSAK